jgi:serine/threonine-protein kinase PpkA
MARVYRAVQESLQRPVALKVLSPSDDPNFSLRFMQEGRTVARLRHPGIVTLYDIGVDGAQHYISMELVEGGDLEARVGKGMKPLEALSILQQLSQCLEYVHAQGVIHRDIKPANILFRDNGSDSALLSDFGIAKQLGQELNLTQTDVALGSPYYLSPEQSQGKTVDGRSDIYSLGIVLFEMLSGKPPFRGKVAMDTILMHINEPLPLLKPSLRHLQPLIERMSAKTPGDRFRNCAQLGQALTEAVAEHNERLAQKKTRRATRQKARPATPAAPDPARAEGQGRRALLVALIALPLGYFLMDGARQLLRLGGLIAAEPSDPVAIQWQGQDRARLNRLLAQAKRHLQADRLSRPAKDNALHLYRQALGIDPHNREATQGLQAIVARYQTLAGEAQARGDTQQAQTLLQRGQQVAAWPGALQAPAPPPDADSVAVPGPGKR